MDIKCVVCGEPWDAYGIRHGDMKAWQAKLFEAGAGCPSCEGVEPENPWHPETIEDIENGDEDPVIRLNLYEERETRPKWEPPEPKLLYKCDACGCQIMEDLEGEDPDACIFARGGDAFVGYKLDRMSDEDLRNPFKLGKEKNLTVCPVCVECCDEPGCDARLCSKLSHDIYDGLASFSGSDCGQNWDETYCVDHFEQHNSEMESEAESEEEVEDESDRSGSAGHDETESS